VYGSAGSSFFILIHFSRNDVAGKDLSNVKIFCVGDKSRGFFQRFLKVILES
jgi:hypothetical protein